MKIIGIILMFLFLFMSNASAMDISLDQVKMSNTIKKSLRNQPEHWVVQSFRLVYFQDLDQANSARKSSFPDVCDGVSLVLKFCIYQVEYVDIAKPIDLVFDNEEKHMMIKEVKIFLYKYFRDQVGYETEKEEKRKDKKKPIKEVVKEINPYEMKLL